MLQSIISESWLWLLVAAVLFCLFCLRKRKMITKPGSGKRQGSKSEEPGASERDTETVSSGSASVQLRPVRRWLVGTEHLPLIELPGSDRGFDPDQRESMIAACRQIDALSELIPAPARPPEPDPYGEEIRRRPMKAISEMGKLSASDLHLRTMYPQLFWYQLATGRFVIRERVSRRKKRGVFMLADGSSSTAQNGKHERICGTVLSRLNRVLEGDFEAWVAVADVALGEVKHANNREEVQNLILDFADHHHTGGGTNMPNSIRGAHEWIERLLLERPDLERPDIWVLSDTDKFGAISPEEVAGTKVFGFVFGGENAPMADFARSTGGMAFENL